MYLKRTALIVLLWMFALQAGAVVHAWDQLSDTPKSSQAHACHEAIELTHKNDSIAQAEPNMHAKHAAANAYQESCESGCQCCFTGCHYGAISVVNMTRSQPPLYFQGQYQFALIDVSTDTLYRPPITR